MKKTLLFLLFLSAAAGAQGVQDFCNQPYELICGPSLQRNKKRDLRLEERTQQIITEAKRNVLIALPDANPAELDFKSEEHAKGILTSRQLEIANLYFEGIYQALRKKIGKSFNDFKPAFIQVQKYLTKTIHQRIQFNNPEDAEKMLLALSSDRVEFVDALEILSSKPANKAELLSNLVESCGKDGMEDNDFAIELDEKNYVVICPGDYLAISADSANKKMTFQDLAAQLWTLGHEMGHLIDAGAFPKSYTQFHTCVDENYLEDLAPIEGKILSDYMGEISADYWGTEALADILKYVNDNQQRLIILQNSLESLCGTEKDDVHPDGRFRIENLVRRNPRLSEVLGCEEDLEIEFKPSCTLRGAWKKRYW